MIRSLIMAVVLLICSVSLGFAQQTAMPQVKAKPAGEMKLKSFTGKVEAVSTADAATGTKSEISVMEDSGKKFTFLVKSTTTIYGSDSNAVSLDKISKGEKVKVKYDITKEGVHEAVSIHVIK